MYAAVQSGMMCIKIALITDFGADTSKNLKLKHSALGPHSLPKNCRINMVLKFQNISKFADLELNFYYQSLFSMF